MNREAIGSYSARMSSQLPVASSFADQLSALEAVGRRRRLIPREGRDFASNDYLGLAADPAIAAAVAQALAQGVPVGSGGSRLLRGNTAQHEALEAKAAAFFGAEAALYFANGFDANLALLSTLPQRGDLIVADRLIHASAHEGIARSRARHFFAAHNDPQAFEDAILNWRAQGRTGQAWIVIETLYSMDGDIAPIAAFADIAARHDAWLVLDEAHGTGVFGPGGRGIGHALEGRPHILSLHTCGKALGVQGALICGPRVAVDFLVNRARPFIFSTAPSPLLAVAVGAALDRVAAGDALRARLDALRRHAGAVLCAPLGLPEPQSQIIPVILGGDERTMRAAAALQQAGFDVRGIRPPTVPEGTARLRIALTLNVDEADIDALAETLRPALETAGA